MSDKMMLETTDPKEALRQIANYLRTVDMTLEREVKQGVEVIGYWQCPEWLEGLKEIADECDRIRLAEKESVLSMARSTNEGLITEMSTDDALTTGISHP